jgi:hypothetical protein
VLEIGSTVDLQQVRDIPWVPNIDIQEVVLQFNCTVAMQIVLAMKTAK